MRKNLIIEFKKPVLDLNTKLRVYRAEKNVFIRLQSPRLLIHPFLIYNTINKDLGIGLTPFIKIEEDGSLDAYSIALENLNEKTLNICTTCNYYTLDYSSVVVVDKVMGKMLKLLKVIPYKGVEYEDLEDCNIYVKALHPQQDHALFISDEGGLGKIIATPSSISIEVLHNCSKYDVSKNDVFRTSICVNDAVHTAVSDDVYGFSAKLRSKHFLDKLGEVKVYGYIRNNVFFVGLGEKGYAFKLRDSSTSDEYYFIEHFKPLAFVDNDMLLAVGSNMLILLRLNNNNLIILNKVGPQDIVEYFPNRENSYIVVLREGDVYIHEVSDTFTYTKIRVRDTIEAATFVKDKILLFKKNCVEMYEVDVSPTHVYVERLLVIPRYLTNCVTLEDDLILCIDRLGRLILSSVEDLLDPIPKVKSLRSSAGFAFHIFNGFTPLAINPYYESSLIKVRTNQYLLQTEKFMNVFDLINLNINMDNNLYRVYTDIPKNIGNIRILQIEDKYIVLKPASDEYNGRILVKRPYDGDTPRVHHVVSDNAMSDVYIVKTFKDLEWGIRLDKSNVITLNVNDVVNYVNDKICLNIEKLKFIDDYLKNSLSLIAVCSNTIAEGTCIDISSCEKLVKLVLNVRGRYISLPSQMFIKPRTLFRDDVLEIRMGYRRGAWELILPKKCVELDSVVLNLSESKTVIQLSNRCKNVWGTVVIENNVFVVKPESKNDVAIDIDLSGILSDSGLHILILESTGRAFHYSIPIGVRHVLAVAVNTALKIARILGIRSSDFKLLDYVYKNFDQVYK